MNHDAASGGALLPAARQGGEPVQGEAVAWRYKFPNQRGGYVWRFSAERWNGYDPVASEPLYVAVPPRRTPAPSAIEQPNTLREADNVRGEREAFEKWAERELQDRRELTAENAMYVYAVWQGWQARAALQGEPSAPDKVPAEPTDAMCRAGEAALRYEDEHHTGATYGAVANAIWREMYRTALQGEQS